VSLSNLRVFGCLAFVQIPKENRKKLDPVSAGKIFVGYCENSMGRGIGCLVSMGLASWSRREILS